MVHIPLEKTVVMGLTVLRVMIEGAIMRLKFLSHFQTIRLLAKINASLLFPLRSTFGRNLPSILCIKQTLQNTLKIGYLDAMKAKTSFHLMKLALKS